MNKKVLVVEDQFVEANDLQIMLRKAGYDVCGIARSVEIAEEIIAKEQPDLVLLDIFLKGKRTGIDLARQLRKSNTAFIYLSANSNEEILAAAKTTEPYGFIVKPFRERDLLVTLEIARYRHEFSKEARFRREEEVIGQLEALALTETSLKEKILQIGKILQHQMPFDFLEFIRHGDTQEKEYINLLRIGFDEYQMMGLDELAMVAGVQRQKLADYLAASAIAYDNGCFTEDVFEEVARRSSLKGLIKSAFQMRSVLSIPIQLAAGRSLCLSFYSRRSAAYNSDHVAFVGRLQHALKKTIEPDAPERRAVGKPQNSSSSSAPGFGGIIGTSHLLLSVFDLVAQVAPFDTSVLVLGESGTGKEKIAECIHNLSPRKRKPLVKLNCATLPASLIESELFGHEKGSFTGAIEKRIGKFELANGGTIFLDEIGEMSIDLQVKLLRVLQEKEIEPIGGRSPVKIDVRVIAATNRNLEKEVAEGRFRLDLYYRLNVFPVLLPPLRERLEDIPVLVQHFIGIFNRKSGRNITGLSDKVMNSIMAYSWPGNIRELENLIERAVLISKGTTIDDIFLPASQSSSIAAHTQLSHMKTIQENERDYIIAVLKQCDGKVWGSGGAAEILGIPPSTLKSKMKKLGIQKEAFD